MTTLIFAGIDDASPLIHLEAADVEVVERLTKLRGFALIGVEPLSPGRAAAEFLHGLSPDQWDDWQPRLESTPMFGVQSVLEQSDAYPDLIAWNPVTWMEWDLDALDAAVQAARAAARGSGRGARR